MPFGSLVALRLERKGYILSDTFIPDVTDAYASTIGGPATTTLEAVDMAVLANLVGSKNDGMG